MMANGYLVVWNGVRDGRDGDLLDAGLRVTLKRIATPNLLENPAKTDQEKVWIAIRRAPGSTAREIATAYGWSHDAVRNCCYHLKQVGRLKHSPNGDKRSGGGRASFRYWTKGC